MDRWNDEKAKEGEYEPLKSRSDQPSEESDGVDCQKGSDIQIEKPFRRTSEQSSVVMELKQLPRVNEDKMISKYYIPREEWEDKPRESGMDK